MFAFFLVEIFQEQKQLRGLLFLGGQARWLQGSYNRLSPLVIPSASILRGLDFKRNLGWPLAKGVK